MKTITQSLQLRVPPQLRKNADEVLSEIGLDMPTAVRLFLNKIVQTRSIPFSLEAPEITVEYVPVDAKTQIKMDEIGALLRKRKTVGK